MINERSRGAAITLIGAVIAFLLILILAHFSARAQPKVKYHPLSSVKDKAGWKDVEIGSISITDTFIHIRVSGDTTKRKNIPYVHKFRLYNKDHYRISHGWLIVSRFGATLEEGHHITKYTFKE
jgi:hypothetical protein